MPRPANPDLIRSWKINLPATLAGRLELSLANPVHSKPIYGLRGKLIESLLVWYLAREAGRSGDDLPHVPSLAELRTMGEH